MLILRCQCLDFKMASKICRINNHNDVAQKLKEMTDIHRNKIELEKKHLNKQIVQSMQGLTNEQKIPHVFTCLNDFRQVMKSALKTYFNA